MPRFIKQTFTVLVLLLLGFSGSLTTKCISLNKQSQRTRLTLTDVNPPELYYDPFIVILDRLDGSCNTAEDAFCRICLSNNIENTNLKVFSMIKGIKDSKKIKKHISCESSCIFDFRKCNSKQKWNNDKC